MTTILVIDDEVSLLENIVSLLEFSDYSVIRADNGILGLELAREYLPNLIVCDVMMPDIDGFEVLKELRSNSRTSMIPFIFLTAKSDRIDQRRGMSLGADDYLTKPFADEELLIAIDARLTKHEHIEKAHLQQYAEYLVESQEYERKAIADDLQITVSDKLINLRFVLDIVSALPPEMIKEAVIELRDILDSAIFDANRLKSQIYPALLEQVGLIPVLSSYLDEYRKIYSVTVNHTQMNAGGRIDVKQELVLFRIVQEVLSSDVAKSSDTIDVIMWREENTLHLQVNCRELDKAQSPELAIPKQMRLREYARSISARLNIQLNVSELSLSVAVDEISSSVPQSTTSGDEQQGTLSFDADKPIDVILGVENENIAFYFQSYLEQFDLIRETIICPDFQTLCEANNRSSAILILDLALTDAELLTLCKMYPVIALTNTTDQNTLNRFHELGVRSILTKDKVTVELMNVIRNVAQGNIAVSKPEPDYLPPVHQAITVQDILTKRECEILEYIVQDKTHAEIAEELFISPRTVEKHRANIMHKLSLNSHTELILFAVRHGIIEV